MNICESLTVPARLFPDRVALVFGEREFRYRELDQLSQAAADWLVAAGVNAGDRVGLMLPNAPSFAIWYYAVLRIGAIAVSISTRLTPDEVEFMMSDCEAVAFIASEPAFASLEQKLPTHVRTRTAVDDVSGNPPEASLDQAGRTGDPAHQQWHSAEPDDAALILYTSGTTGFPKGATLSHANVRSNVHAFNHLCNMQPADRVLLAVPLFHCFGQNALLNSVLNVGGTIVLQQRFDLNESKQLIQQHQVTQLYGVPMMFDLFLGSCTPAELASVNYCFSAAATLPIQTSIAWQQKFGLPIHEGYGLTETSPFASYNHRLRFQPGSIGMAIDSVEIRIVDTETGEPCPPGELGEIAIRGPNVMLGYWNRPAETAEAIRDGWFHSGDIGRVDEAGYLFIVDRVKDMITVGGLKVFPAEVERVLLDHESVAQAAVIGAPDPVFGEQVVGFLVLADPQADRASQLQELEQYAKTRLGNYKLPRRLVALDELPRNPSGKVLKTQLRERISQPDPNQLSVDSESPPVAANLQPPELRERLQRVHASERTLTTVRFLQAQMQAIGELEEVPDPEQSFIEAGLDSLAIVGLSAQLQVEVGPQHTLPPTLLFDFPRIADLAEFLVSTLSETAAPPADPPRQSAPAHEPIPQADQIRSDIEQMSEEEALAELMKELD